MAAVNEGKKNSESITFAKDSVILLSDDDEQEESNSRNLLSTFVTEIENFVPKDVMVLLLTKFDEASTAFVTSSTFKETLRRLNKVVTQENAYIHTRKICDQLIANKHVVVSHNVNQTLWKTETKDTDSKNADDSEAQKVARNFKQDNTIKLQALENGQNTNSIADNSDSDDFVEIVSVNLIKDHSTATGKNDVKSQHLKSKSPKTIKVAGSKGLVNGTTTSHGNHEKNRSLSPRKRQKVVKVLEQKLKHIDDRIKILNKAELTLEEMEYGDSTYIQECRLKEKFNEIWNKICKLQGRPPQTGRVTEKKVKCKSTGYPEIDHAVKRFLEKKIGFPDVFDIRHVISRATKKYNLKISQQVQQELVEDVFSDIGNKLQKRRKIDFEYNFGCGLTDVYKADKDPAMHDFALRKKLDKNKRKGKKALNKVFEHYVYMNRHKKQNVNYSSSESDAEKERLYHSSKESNGAASRVSDSESHTGSNFEDDEQNLQENDDFEVKLNDSQDIVASEVSLIASNSSYAKEPLEKCSDEEDKVAIDCCDSVGDSQSDVHHKNVEEMLETNPNQADKTETTSSSLNNAWSAATAEEKNKKSKRLCDVIDSLKSQESFLASDKGFGTASDYISSEQGFDTKPSRNPKNDLDSPTCVSVSSKLSSDNTTSKETPGPAVSSSELSIDFKKMDQPKFKTSAVTGKNSLTSSLSVDAVTTSKKRVANQNDLPLEPHSKVYQLEQAVGNKPVQTKKDVIDLTSPDSKHTKIANNFTFMDVQTDSKTSCSVEKLNVKPVSTAVIVID